MNEYRHKKNVENAAKMIVTKFGDFPEETMLQMKTCYEKEEYQEVLDLAASHDVPNRESLASKITMFPNPDFKEEIDLTEIQMQMEAALDEFVEKWSKNQSEKNCSPLFKCPEDEEVPRFFFKAEGIEETFNSASQAIIAWKEKNTCASPSKKHTFKSIPKEIE